MVLGNRRRIGCEGDLRLRALQSILFLTALRHAKIVRAVRQEGKLHISMFPNGHLIPHSGTESSRSTCRCIRLPRS